MEFMPSIGVQRNGPPGLPSDPPTTTVPSAFVAVATALVLPGNPMPLIVPLTQRKACVLPLPLVLDPTTTVPSEFTDVATLVLPPGKKPRLLMVPFTQRKACSVPTQLLLLQEKPTTTVPSELTP